MGAQATGLPLLPSSFVAGTITISAGQAGTPQNLLALIQAQLDPNASLTPYVIYIQADNSGAVYVGAPNKTGALATTNYGWLIPAGTSATVPGVSPLQLGSYFPGAQPSAQSLSVLMSSTGTFHVLAY